MHVNKTAHNFFQIFYGIDENKLFLQIVNRQGDIEYSFESPELDTSSDLTICEGIMKYSYDFFDPNNFTFKDDFVLAETEPLLVRRHGEKVNPNEKKVIPCRSLLGLPAMNSWLFLESFLPFEKPLLPASTSVPIIPEDVLTNIAYKRGVTILEDSPTNHGMAE